MDPNPLWYRDAIFYEVYVRAFRDANGDGHGDLRGLTESLDYFQELGVDGLWLMPTYPSPLVDDGYDIADYFGVHPDYGTLDDFKDFLDAAHARGLRVITDLVLNHTSDQHPWFQAARTGRSAPLRDYYVWSDTPDRYRDARVIFLDTQQSNWTYDAGSGQYYWHRFYPEQPDLNFDNPKVAQAMKDILAFWLDLGLDGFRADAVPYLFEREGTSCENLPETHAYLKDLRRLLDERYPGRILLAEANQWPEDVRAYFGEGDEMHMAFHFPVMPRIFAALARADARAIVEILQRTPPIPENCQWCTFLRNHDELTLEMVTPEERAFLWDFYAPDPRMRLNLGIRRRLAPLLGGDARRIALAHALLFSLPGTPVLYYGDEIGMGDDVWLDDRDGVRTPMQWTARPGAGFSSAPRERWYAAPLPGGPYGFETVNVAAQQADPGSLWHTLRRLIAARKRQAVFAGGETTFLDAGERAVLAVRRGAGEATVLALHNLGGEQVHATLDLSAHAARTPADLLGTRTFPPVAEGPYRVALGPYEYLWLALGEGGA
jgi:maltose alpha-D-glucosyltransferase/alpha-amylase